MVRYKISIILLTFLLPAFLIAQLKLQSGSVIFIEVDQRADIYTVWHTNKPSDLEWAAKLTGVTKNNITDYHAEMSKKMKTKPGTTLVPINKGYIISNPNFKKWKHAYLAVKYRVKKGETMYTIARNYLDTSAEFIQALNKKSDYSVNNGEELTVGWMLLPVESAVDFEKDQKNVPQVNNRSKGNTTKVDQVQKDIREEMPLRLVTEDVQPQLKEEAFIQIEKNVIGIWDKNGSASENYYALFNDLPPGSYIEAYNPMLRRQIRAKVIGKIPAGTYAPEVELILNPAAARELGLLDIRFNALVKYSSKD